MTIVFSQLEKDLIAMNKNLPVSLCAKWLPSENCSLDREYNIVETFCKFTRMSKRQYRTKYTSPLRAYIKIVERLMCSNRWKKIEYSNVPSYAMKRLKNAFEKHEYVLFTEWKNKLKKGVNPKQVLPHELIQIIKQKYYADIVCEAQWKIIEQQAASLADSIAVCDVSGSMDSWEFGKSTITSNLSFIPKDVAIGLSLLIAHKTQGTFHNHIITFHNNPTFHVVPNSSLYNRYKSISGAKWGNNINLKAIFNMILTNSKTARLSNKDIPKRIFIISDMQFDTATRNGDCQTKSVINFEEIQEQYVEAGYKRPQIIFWNVVGSDDENPVKIHENGNVIISGFSPVIMKAIIQGQDFNSYSIMRATLDSIRYKPIKQALSKPYDHVPMQKPVVLFLIGWEYGIHREDATKYAQRIIDRYANKHPRIVTWNGDLLLKSEVLTSYTYCLPILRKAFPLTTFVVFKLENNISSLGYRYQEETEFGIKTGYPKIFGKSISYYDNLLLGYFYIHPMYKNTNKTMEAHNIIRHWLDRNFDVNYVTIGGDNIISDPIEKFTTEISVWSLEAQRINKENKLELSHEVNVENFPKV